jgi:hypothetical protein
MSATSAGPQERTKRRLWSKPNQPYQFGSA